MPFVAHLVTELVTELSVVVVDVPVMGESISEGSIEVLSVAVGDAVAVDDVIGSIETDKVGPCCWQRVW